MLLPPPNLYMADGRLESCAGLVIGIISLQEDTCRACLLDSATQVQ